MSEGWLCPRCNAVNAPSVQKCACSPAEKKNELQDFVTELRKLCEKYPQPQPIFVPVYPHYPRPYWREPYWLGDVICNNQSNLQNQYSSPARQRRCPAR